MIFSTTRYSARVPRLIVPDNLKSGVNRAGFYNPEINRSYAMMASHYGVGVLPARPRKPRDKAKVENGVRFAQACILGRLRHQTFFSLAEANGIFVAVSSPCFELWLVLHYRDQTADISCRSLKADAIYSRIRSATR